MRTPFAATLVLLLAASVRAEEQKPVPHLQAIPLPNDEASMQCGGLELTRYHFGPDLDRPFLYPLRHPATGRSLTRMGHPHDPESHSHHNSVWISHHNIDGLTFWIDGDRNGTGTIRHVRINAYADSSDAEEDAKRNPDGSPIEEAVIDSLNHWVRIEDGKTVLVERRKSTVSLVPDALGGGWILVLELEFSGPEEKPVTFEADPFGVIGVRMAKTIGVNDGGGRILNAEGFVNEEAVFRRPARWVDYSGRVTNDCEGGITLFDAPENPGHPSPFHVRNDGWMGICLSLNGPVVVRPGKPLRLRYGLWMHDGMPDKASIEPVWDSFSKPPVARP